MNTSINLNTMIFGFDGNKMTVALYNQSASTTLTKQEAKALIKELKKVVKDKK